MTPPNHPPTSLSDASFVWAATQAGLRPSLCPSCDGVLTRDVRVALTYVCRDCAVRWTATI